MTREEAIKWIEQISERYIHGGDDDFDAKRREALNMAIKALRTRKFTLPNDPLTLEQLLEMDGEPVWVQYGQYDGEWVIVAWNIYDAISYTRKAPFKLSVYSYGDTWLAYRRKPEEGTA